jgi:epoxyqueuosine reductase
VLRTFRPAIHPDGGTRFARAVQRALQFAYDQALKRFGLMRFAPSERGPRVPPPWTRSRAETPPELRTVPGIWRDEEEEERAFRTAPLHDYFALHVESQEWILRRASSYIVPTAGRLQRAIRHARMVRRGMPAQPVATSPEDLAGAIRAEAQRCGLSAIGFAPYDPKYIFSEYAGRHDKGTVIVCVLEQDYAATQTAPSTAAERAAMHAYAEVVERAARLAEFIQGLGYRADPHDHLGEGVIIHYGVEAGLGQLGLNGQLLTPAAGSRARISAITTNLELPADGPVDHGVHAICDACQVCVRRCPTGAIPLRRAMHRGVTKAKIKTERCLPVVAQVEGCAVCMRVCPVQKYGLDAVKTHYARTGEILGKGTDELEGYHWPLDDRHYGPREKPRIDSDALLHPPDLVLDLTRTEPPPGAKSLLAKAGEY